MILQLSIIGWLLVVLSLAHAVFPRYFNWRTEFQTVSLINRQMMYIHTFFVALVVFLMGVLCLTCQTELLLPGLGQKLALAFAVFWTTRLVIQFWGYSAELWRGKRFETTVHILFTAFWTYLSGVFWAIGLSN
jgi:hypothetical protein